MSRVSTRTQVSAGGVAFRKKGSRTEVVIVSIGNNHRWQLPKGIVNTGESSESAAMREVREETGVETEIIGVIDKVEYWYYSIERGERVRFHKFVHFYLLRYKSGDVRNHDWEVNEARWVEIDKACQMLAFKSEREIVKRAKGMIKELE
jgi:ADP-ribose pyrophosphatase YjhB (NUDIX family)